MIRLRDSDQRYIEEETEFLQDDLNDRLAFLLREHKKLKYQMERLKNNPEQPQHNRNGG